MKFLFHSIAAFLLAIIFFSCSTSRNTFIHRGYHNLNARFNGYYHSCEAISDGIYKVKKEYKENYEEILPVFMYPTEANVKNYFPEFDRAIKKSSRCIQMHAIKDEKGNVIPKSGRWIDNNWINIGIARIYKREFFSGVEALDYVVRTYGHSKDKYLAMIWMIRAYNEVGAVSMAEPILSLLKNEKKIPKKIKSMLPVVQADYYLRKGLYAEAYASLKQSVKNKNIFYGIPREERARYHFIMGQILQLQNRNKEAAEQYARCYKLKPGFEMMFYSKIRLMALRESGKKNTQPMKKTLLRMAKEDKYVDHRDVIYFTLGEIEQKEGNAIKAKEYFRTSVSVSTKNQVQKAYSYLKLGEIYFEEADYPRSHKYYDSALISLPTTHPKYKEIQQRQKILEELVTHLLTIQREDSLLRLSFMSEQEQNAIIDKIIHRFIEEEKKKKNEASSNANSSVPGSGMGLGNTTLPGSDPLSAMNTGSAVSFYFYNQNTVLKGMVDFTKKWGNRKNEDNWRRFNKVSDLTSPDVTNNTANTSTTTADFESELKKDPRAQRDFYRKNIPRDDSARSKASRKLFNAYIQAGTIYKEDLKNYKKAIEILEELNRKYPSNPYKLNAYVLLYRIADVRNHQQTKEEYKQKIINEFPNSEMAKFLMNPDYLKEKSTEAGAAEKAYEGVLKLYLNKQYSDVIREVPVKHKELGLNPYSPNFEYLRALSFGYLHQNDSLEFYLKKLVLLYPKSEQAEIAKRTLEEIEKNRKKDTLLTKTKSLKDTFLYKPELEHFVVISCPDNTNEVENMKGKVFYFNSKFYSNASFQITSMIFKPGIQWIVIKPFSSMKDAMTYYQNLSVDPEVFNAEDSQKFTPFIIHTENYILLNRIKELQAYLDFFREKYKPSP